MAPSSMRLTATPRGWCHVEQIGVENSWRSCRRGYSAHKRHSLSAILVANNLLSLDRTDSGRSSNLWHYQSNSHVTGHPDPTASQSVASCSLELPKLTIITIDASFRPRLFHCTLQLLQVDVSEPNARVCSSPSTDQEIPLLQDVAGLSIIKRLTIVARDLLKSISSIHTVSPGLHNASSTRSLEQDIRLHHAIL